MFPLNLKDYVSHPYRTKGKLMVVYISISTFWTADGKTEGSRLNGNKSYQNYNLQTLKNKKIKQKNKNYQKSISS
jgi:hypothetical protein